VTSRSFGTHYTLRSDTTVESATHWRPGRFRIRSSRGGRPIAGDRGFESISLQRGVQCEPDFRGRPPIPLAIRGYCASSADISIVPSGSTLICRPEKVCTDAILKGARKRTRNRSGLSRFRRRSLASVRPAYGRYARRWFARGLGSERRLRVAQEAWRTPAVPSPSRAPAPRGRRSIRPGLSLVLVRVVPTPRRLHLVICVAPSQSAADRHRQCRERPRGHHGAGGRLPTRKESAT